MATCSKLPLLFVLAAAAVCAAATIPVAAAEDAPVQQVDLDNPHVQQLGQWAVEEHVKQANDQLRFFRVVDGHFQYVLGRLNYELVIDTLNDAEQTEVNHTALLYEDGWSNSRNLVSFI
ncbi:unnamed protein product [Alopecurus aequalis]